MFKFLRRMNAPVNTSALLADCEREMNRIAKAHPGMTTNPRDVNLRMSLLQKAAEAGLSEHVTIKRFGFLHDLIEAVTVDPTPAPEVLQPLLEAATGYQFEDIQAVRLLRRHLDLVRLKQDGPRIVGRDRQNRPVYFQGTAEFRNKPGRFEVRADGVSFTGEVSIEVPWSNVAHASRTTHTYKGSDYVAIALQEGKRRTPTKFVFPLYGEADYACEVTMASWEKHLTVAANPRH